MGIVIVFMMLMYILVTVGISKVVYRFIQNYFISNLVFICLVTFPFWDLIVQKAIKTYYINLGLVESKIYAMPKKDENEMIEGLSLAKVTSEGNFWLRDSKTIKRLLSEIYGFREDSKLKFLDLRFEYGKYPNYTYEILRFSCENSTYIPIPLDIKEPDARYKITYEKTSKLQKTHQTGRPSRFYPATPVA